MDGLSGLPKDVQGRILSLIPQNDVACNLRPVNKAFASFINSPEHKKVRLSSPVPHHAFAWRWGRRSPYLRFLDRKQRLKLLELTATSGDLENLVVVLDSVGILVNSGGKAPNAGADACAAAAAAGHLHVCEYLSRKGWRWFSALFGAARGGHRAICEWSVEWARQANNNTAIAREAEFVRDAACEAVKAGHLDLAEYLQQLAYARARAQAGHDLSGAFLAAVAEGCDLATLKRFHNDWLGEPGAPFPPGLPAGEGGGIQQLPLPLQHQQQQPPEAAPWLLQMARYVSSCRIMRAAICSPTPDWQAKAEWLERMGYPRDLEASPVSPVDAVERLTWLRQRGYPVAEAAVKEAVHAGNTAALEYLLGEEFNGMRAVSVYDIAEAARGGHLAALRLLHAHGCPVDPLAVIGEAARGGHLAVVAWLVEALDVDVADLGPEVMHAAAESGNVELLTWLHERGCRPGEQALVMAVESGCEAALEWLVERGCVWPAYHIWDVRRRTPYAVAAQYGDLAMMRCLRRLGCPWGQATRTGGRSTLFEDCVARGLALDGLRWLVDEGCPVVWGEALEAADRRDDGGVLEWLRQEARKRRSQGEGA